MGPMGPRGLGPWALWAPGALKQKLKKGSGMTPPHPPPPSQTKLTHWLVIDV